MTRETTLSPANFVQPLFLQDGSENTAILSMPGVTRWAESSIVEEACSIHRLGIPAIVLFPKIPDHLKTNDAAESYNPLGLIPRVVQAIKQACPALVVITDVALDPYNSDGHDGIVRTNTKGEAVILNDETVQILCEQALSHARAGADIVSPSDMMDGRVGAIRLALDAAGFSSVSILSYSAKYASSFYGPFRGALDSAPKDGDKKSYQMDSANAREALRELLLDESEGADMLMIKPAGPYLDIIAQAREHSNLPIAAYQVSGEYLMIQSACAAGWLDRKAVVLESLIGIKRAGANIILTYYAKEAALWLNESH
jgi:porphobilinogen synthase